MATKHSASEDREVQGSVVLPSTTGCTRFVAHIVLDTEDAMGTKICYSENLLEEPTWVRLRAP